MNDGLDFQLERVAIAIWNSLIEPGGRGRTLMPWPFCPEASWCRATAAAAIKASKNEVVFRHKKSGGLYNLLSIGQMQARDWYEHGESDWSETQRSVDMEEVVVYQSLEDDKVWVRPINDFNQRFEKVNDV